jgi:hypothetical protein
MMDFKSQLVHGLHASMYISADSIAYREIVGNPEECDLA